MLAAFQLSGSWGREFRELKGFLLGRGGSGVWQKGRGCRGVRGSDAGILGSCKSCWQGASAVNRRSPRNLCMQPKRSRV